MRTLVVGGSGSGKSAFSERLCCILGSPRIYVATMATDGQEARTRIERHRAQRADLGFSTIERTSSLAGCEPGPTAASGVLLLDDLGNLAANALFSPDGTMADPHGVLERLAGEVIGLTDCFRHAVVVGNLAGSEGRPAYPTTEAWVRLVGALCCRLARDFDTVVEVTAGVAAPVKGALP